MGNFNSGMENDPDMSDGEISEDSRGGDNAATCAAIRVKDNECTDFSDIVDGHRLDLSFLFSPDSLKAATLRIKEELPVNVLQAHQAYLINWLEDRAARNEESITLGQFCDLLAERSVGRTDAMRAFEKFDGDGSGTAEVQSMLQILNSLASVYGGGGTVSNESEMAYCSKALQGCPLLPGFVDVFTSMESSSKHANRMFNFLIRNRAAASSFVYPHLDSFHDTTHMRETVARNYFESVHLDANIDDAEGTSPTREGVKVVLKPYAAIEVSTNTGSADKLIDGDTATFWQSDGSARSHWIRVRMKPGVLVKQLFIYVSSSDQSYMPSEITVAVGKSCQSLHNTREIRIPSHVTGPVLLLENMKSYFPFVQIFIKRCQNDGCDTRVRLLKVIGCSRLSKEHGVSVGDATVLWFVQIMAATATACLPAAPALHEVILQQTRQALQDIPPLSFSSGCPERPSYATDSVLNEVGRFIEEINRTGGSGAMAPADSSRLASGLHVQLSFSLARGSLLSIISALIALLENHSSKLKAVKLLLSLEAAKMRFLKTRARQLTMSLASCDRSGTSSDTTEPAAENTADDGADSDGEEEEGAAAEQAVPASAVLTPTDWAAPIRPYLTPHGKRSVTMMFKGTDCLQLTKVKIKVDKGGRGARSGMVFLLDGSTSLDNDALMKQYEKYDSWTEADYTQFRSSQMNDMYAGPAAFFTIPDDWDECDVPLSTYGTCQLVMVKFLRPRSESSDRIGIVGIKFYGYSRSKEFKLETEEGVTKLSEDDKEMELMPEDIVNNVLSFLLAISRSQEPANSRKGFQAVNGIDVSGVSVNVLWKLYNAVLPERNRKYDGIRLKSLHLMHIVFVHSSSNFGEEEATKEMFDSFTSLIDSPAGAGAEMLSIVQKILLDGAKVFFPHEKTRREQLLKMMDSSSGTDVAPSRSLVFESLCRFYSTVDPSGLLNLPKLNTSKAYIDVHFLDIMDVMLSATLRNFKLSISDSKQKPSPALFRLLCCLQTTFVCWVKAARTRGPDSGMAGGGWAAVGESAIVTYVQLLTKYNKEAFCFLSTLEVADLPPLLRNEDESSFFKVIRQMVTILLSMTPALGHHTLEKVLESLLPLTKYLDLLASVLPDFFLKPDSDLWNNTSAGKTIVLRTWEEESVHNYANNQHLTRMYSSPGASTMVVEFDSRCETERRYDYLEFTDVTGTKTRYDHKVGTDKWPARVEFRGSKLQFLFHSDPSNNEWGYKFKVIAYGSPEVTFSWPFDLQLSLAKLIGRICSRLLSSSTAVTSGAVHVEPESAEAALLRSDLWRTLFRAGYTPPSVQHTLSGYHSTIPDDAKDFLLALLDTPEEPYIVSFLQRCQEKSKIKHAFGGEVADHTVCAIFAALLWHTPQLHEDIENYVAYSFAASQLTDGISLAYSVAEGLRTQLVIARQKQQEKYCPQDQHILKEIASKASFLLKFACLTRMQLRTDTHRQSLKSAKMRRHVGHLSADVEVIWKLDSSSFERFPTFRFILEFILESSWTMENVEKVIQERRAKAEAVANAYNHALSFLKLSAGAGRSIFEVQNVVLFVELLTTQKDMPRHYLDFLDGCGLQLESSVRQNFYNFVTHVVDAVASVKRASLSRNILATYDVILAATLHLLAVDWRPYDLAFVDMLKLPFFLLNVTKDTVAAQKAVKCETNVAEELEEYERAMRWLKEERNQLETLLEMSRNSSSSEASKAVKAFVAKYSDVLEVETVCDGCSTTLPGRRYRCLQCLDTDICAECFSGAIQPLRGHKEDHDFVHFMFKCNQCHGFISGERTHCEDCDDFDLCLGCYQACCEQGYFETSNWSPCDHLPTHRLTKHPQTRFKLPGSLNTCMAAYIHQCAWLQYIQLTLALAGTVWSREPPGSAVLLREETSYSDFASRLLMSSVELVTSCLQQAALTSRTDESESAIDADQERQAAFVQNFQERAMGLLGAMVILEGQCGTGQVMSSFFNTADFLKLLLLIASGCGTNCEPAVQHVALGLLGQLLTKASADLRAADEAVEDIKLLLPEMKRQTVHAGAIPGEPALIRTEDAEPDGKRTVTYLVHLATLCLDRQLNFDWCAAIVHVLQNLLASDLWYPLVTGFIKASMLQALTVVDTEVIVAYLVMAGFPQILFPGMRVKYLDCAAEDRQGIVLKQYTDKMQSIIIDIKSRSRHMVRYSDTEPLETFSFPFDEELLVQVADYIELSVSSLREGKPLNVNQLWALGLCLKAFSQAVGGRYSASSATQMRLVPLLVHMASLSTGFSHQWLVSDIEVLAAMQYTQVDAHRICESISGNDQILPTMPKANAKAEPQPSALEQEQVNRPVPEVERDMNVAGIKGMRKVPAYVPASSSSVCWHSPATLEAIQEPDDESGFAGLMAGLAMDNAGKNSRPKRAESAKLLKEELDSGTALKILRCPGTSTKAAPGQPVEDFSSARLEHTSHAIHVNTAVCIVFARQTLLSILSSWPDGSQSPLNTALLFDGRGMTAFLSVLDLLNSSNESAKFQQVVAKLMSCCDESCLPEVAVTAATFMEEEEAIVHVRESAHEKSSDTSVPVTKVVIPGAPCLRLRFDKRCSTVEGTNKLCISSTEDCSEKAHELSGTSRDSWPDIDLPGDTFYYKYTVNNEDSGLWGWRFTICSQQGRFETGHIILRQLLASRNMARLLPASDLWCRLIRVACSHNGEHRLKSIQLLLLIINTQIGLHQSSSGTAAAAKLELQLLLPLWKLYDGLLQKSGLEKPCLSQLVRALTELFLCVENFVLMFGYDREYASLFLEKPQLMALVYEGLLNVKAVSVAIGYCNKSTVDVDICRDVTRDNGTNSDSRKSIPNFIDTALD